MDWDDKRFQDYDYDRRRGYSRQWDDYVDNFEDDYRDDFRDDYWDDYPDRAPRRGSGSKRRPPKKSGRGSALSNPIVYLLVVCGVSLLLAVLGWTVADDVLALNKDEVTAVISVSEDKDFGSVVNQLKSNGIIRYKGIFRLFASVSHGADKISPGTYELNTDMDYRAILNSLGSSSVNRMVTSVTIPEGYTVDQIFSLLEEKGVSTVEQLEETASSHSYNFSFLLDIPMGDYKRLEGYLFPDTYEFYMGEDPIYVINKMLVNFDAKVTEEMRQQVWDQGYSIGQILTIASMIEKETDGSDRALVSSVIFNRLNNPGAGTQGYLQIDATIQYLLPPEQVVSERDIEEIESPYNTYKNKGLPPGPIANPGLSSIVAALNPEHSNYFYYALGSDGYHHYFTNYSEFQSFVYG